MILARVGDKKQTRRQNFAEIVSGGISETQCIIFQQNNVITYEIQTLIQVLYYWKPLGIWASLGYVTGIAAH